MWAAAIAAVGGAIGSIIPGVGTAIGATLGGALGTVLDGPTAAANRQQPTTTPQQRQQGPAPDTSGSGSDVGALSPLVIVAGAVGLYFALRK